MADITVEQVKKHLRLALDTSDEDDMLEMLIETAVRAVRDYLDRSLTDDICRDDDDNTKLAPPLRYAALLMIGDLYENREAQQSSALNINVTCQNLMNPYRKLGL